MKLVTSREAVSFLSQAAPPVWVQRMLKWMIVDAEIDAFARKVAVQPYTSVGRFTIPLFKAANEFSGPELDKAIRAEFPAELAAKLVGKAYDDRVLDNAHTIEDSKYETQVDPGFILYATETDWLDGTLKVDWIDDDIVKRNELFTSQDFLDSEFENASYEVLFEGLVFERRRIEMLLPSFSLSPGGMESFESATHARPIGRPRKWDWEGAMASIISTAQHPDGLPIGEGAQSKIEGMMADWFIAETGNSPATSQLRQRARSIIQSISKGEK